MQNNVNPRSRALEAAKTVVRKLSTGGRRNEDRLHDMFANGLIVRRAATRVPRHARRDAVEGYVVCMELGEATIVAEGGQFAFQVAASDLEVGKKVWFIREGDQFSLI